jgi:hypothetical protein
MTGVVPSYIAFRARPAWREATIERPREQPCSEERILFFTARNEWAEANDLEPDRRCGHEYLEAVPTARAQVVLRSAAGA